MALPAAVPFPASVLAVKLFGLTQGLVLLPRGIAAARAAAPRAAVDGHAGPGALLAWRLAAAAVGVGEGVLQLRAVGPKALAYFTVSSAASLVGQPRQKTS
jgi:hypothetical protein